MAKRNGKKASAQGGFSFRRMLADLGPMKRLLGVCLAAVVVSKVLLAFAPAVAGSITDAISASVVSGSFDLAAIGRLCLLLAALYLVGYGTTGFVNKGCVRVAETLARSYRMRMQRKLNKLPLTGTRPATSRRAPPTTSPRRQACWSPPPSRWWSSSRCLRPCSS